MAIKANIYKVNLSVSNINDHHYQDYRLTLAQHPSETDNRTIIRLAAFALYAQEDPQFTKGLSAEEEPELWTHNQMGEIQHWIDLGQPSEKRILKACSKSEQVTIIGYHAAKFKKWFQALERRIQEHAKITFIFLESTGVDKPESLVQKAMDISCTIQDDQMLIGSDQGQANLVISDPASLS